MNQTARSNRYHIGIFGRRNAGKSSLVNALTGQEVSIVSDIAGTTTDTVWKNIELPGIGAAVLADTAGYDDNGALGEKRVERTRQSASRIDLALMLLTDMPDEATYEKEWLQHFASLNIPVVCLMGKSDNSNATEQQRAWEETLGCNIQPISAKTREGVKELLEAMAAIYKSGDNINDITHSLVKEGDIVVLVMPQDAQAPQGRLIQPQVQTLRNLLDKQCLAMCCTPEHLPDMLASLTAPPKLTSICTGGETHSKREPSDIIFNTHGASQRRHRNISCRCRKTALITLRWTHSHSRSMQPYSAKRGYRTCETATTATQEIRRGH